MRAIALSAMLLACNAPQQADLVALERCQKTNDSLTALLKSQTLPDFSDTSQGAVEFYFHPFDRRELRRQGLYAPDSQLLASMRQHPELIPDTTVLGGTMYVEWVKPIGTKWALAQYSDGHVQGRALYAYWREKDGAIGWKLLNSRLD
jgi:hypothetical protein